MYARNDPWFTCAGTAPELTSTTGVQARPTLITSDGSPSAAMDHSSQPGEDGEQDTEVRGAQFGAVCSDRLVSV